MKPGHIKHIDVAKGIGIILVLIGHIFHRGMIDFIYLFHMPLFFFLSGFTMSPQNGLHFLSKKIKSLIVPYFSFLLLITTINVIDSIISGSLSLKDIIKPYTSSLYGGAILRGDFGAYWFITVLFLSLLILNWMIINMKNKHATICIVLMYVFSFIDSFYLDKSPPFAINIVLQSIPIMYIGYLSSGNERLLKRLAMIGIIFTPLYFIFPHDIISVDFKQSSYGIPVINTLISLSFIYAVIYISKKLENSTVLTVIASGSMTIMFLHQWFNLRLVKAGVDNSLAVFLITLLTCLFIHEILNKNDSSRAFFIGRGIKR